MESNNRAASRLVPVAIAPAKARTGEMENDTGIGVTAMRFNCQACVRKKIKCNRGIPTCSSCEKSKLLCVYQAPPMAKRKRKREDQLGDVHERLARYERILQENNLLPMEHVSNPPTKDTDTETETLSEQYPTPESVMQTGMPGKLLSSNGKSRYIQNVLLLDAGEGDLCELSDSDQDEYYNDGTAPDERNPADLGFLAAYAVSGAIIGNTQSLIDKHPDHEMALQLWELYTQNIDPVCKILHIPTIAKIVNTVSKEPITASKSEECILFVIYYFAIVSMLETDCLIRFNRSRDYLMSEYRAAFCQALVNVSWLKTTSLPVLQAYVLFLVALRVQIDPQIFWILTGIAVRIAQRMGLHRDNENLGLPPFEVQMRRRLFWQLLPLDGYAGQVSGTGISIKPDSWDTHQPLNINDDQIFPAMTQQPQEQRGASEMIFCLARIELSNFYARTALKMKKNTGDAIEFKAGDDIERLINEVEGLIETKFLRYCDILNPLHFLTTGVVRSATNAVRLHMRMLSLRKQTISDVQRRDLCTLAQTILDTNAAIYANPNMTRFRWMLQAFFLWDALLCILLSLSKVDFYSPSERNIAWSKVAEVYSNHELLLKAKRALYVYIGKLTIQTWLSNPPTNMDQEPPFLAALRVQGQPGANERMDSVSGGGLDKIAVAVPVFDGVFDNDNGTSMEFNLNFSFDSSDWAIWDRMCAETKLD